MNQKSKKLLYDMCIVVVLCTVLFFVFRLAYRWYIDNTALEILGKGTFWETEDGVLSFENGVTDRIRTHITSTGQEYKVNIGHETTGILVAENEEIPIGVELSDEGPYLLIYLDDGSDPEVVTGTGMAVPLEKWETIGAIETKSKIVVTFKVVETTYFEVGQKIKLVHNR